ncbi:hypothetical protein QTH90_29765 [Variovorax sp. J2P1-59]|uniref:hypothetical protein n=1 Tax=Variovorax flavidus TaxID=3053501 RepID=UPI0025776CE4|nr:hypothetical protein [Variovorax sp. J2P1-59]MDM0078627.1 hypothetical protein [Variovorax sp. J2P1-59]
MASSSILGGEHMPARPRGADVDALGPSDTRDSGSDVESDRFRSALPDDNAQGAPAISHGSSTDAAGAGERASAGAETFRLDTDVLPDRVEMVPRDALYAAESMDPTPDELAAAGEDDAQDDEDGAQV